LLGETWIYTPDALNPACSGQFDDGFGTGTNGIVLACGVDHFAYFDQVVSTVVGQTYTLDFLFSDSPFTSAGPGNEPSQLIVSETAVPEPSSLALLLGVVVLIIVVRSGTPGPRGTGL